MNTISIVAWIDDGPPQSADGPQLRIRRRMARRAKATRGCLWILKGSKISISFRIDLTLSFAVQVSYM